MSNKTNKIEIYLVHGTLGAGKTTFIKQLIKDDYFKNSYIIENEFANYSIDTQILSTQTKVVDISGGCVCCSSGQEFFDALNAISQKNSEKYPVIIETTGAASSVQLIKKLYLSPTFNQSFVLAKNILIVDLLETSHAELQQKQLDIKLADLIVLTKSQEASTTQIEVFKDFVTNLNPLCSVISYNEGKILNTNSIKLVSSRVESTLAENFAEISELIEANHENELSYQVIKMGRRFNTAELKAKVKGLFNANQLLRVKGFYYNEAGESCHLEATRHKISVEVLQSKLTDPKLVFIGRDINNVKLEL